MNSYPKRRLLEILIAGAIALGVLTGMTLATSCAADAPTSTPAPTWVWVAPYFTRDSSQVHTFALVPGDSTHSVSISLSRNPRTGEVELSVFEDEAEVATRYPVAELLLRDAVRRRPLR